MKVTIDKLEGEFAVVLTENGKSITVPAVLFEGCGEGMAYSISRDIPTEEESGKRIKNLMNEVWE